MAVLSNIDMRAVIENNEGLIIMNPRKKSFTAAGYDLTIGFICDADSGILPELVASEKEPSVCRYRLEHGHRYLVVSREYVFFPGQYMATLHSRISYVLKGIVIPSTTIDPNFEGFLYSSLINCSHDDVFIKEHNQFATMVIHRLLTPTDTDLQTNENGFPRDGQGTLNDPFSNISSKAAMLAKTYVTDEFQKIKTDYRAARIQAAKKIQEKQDLAAHARILSEKEQLNEQRMSDLQAQINSMQEQLNTSEQTALAEKKKHRRHTLIQHFVITMLLFALFLVFLNFYWGITLQTFLLSFILSNIWNIPGFIVDTGTIGKKIKNWFKKQ